MFAVQHWAQLVLLYSSNTQIFNTASILYTLMRTLKCFHFRVLSSYECSLCSHSQRKQIKWTINTELTERICLAPFPFMNKNMPKEVNIQGHVDGIGPCSINVKCVLNFLFSSFHFNGGHEHAGGNPEALAALLSSQRLKAKEEAETAELHLSEIRKQLFELAPFYSEQHNGAAVLVSEGVVIFVNTFNPKYSMVHQEETPWKPCICF